MSDDASVARPVPGGVGAIRVVTACLRFIALFGAVGLVVGGWDAIRARWDRLIAVARPGATVSRDAEYFCPMDTGVLSDWADKCPVCNMTLVRRKTGDAAPLPDGVVARMQFSPDRLWLGGVRTATADYAALAREVEAPGSVVAPSRVEAEVFGRDLPWVEAGQSAEVWPLGQAIPTARDVPPPGGDEDAGDGGLGPAGDHAGTGPLRDPDPGTGPPRD